MTAIGGELYLEEIMISDASGNLPCSSVQAGLYFVPCLTAIPPGLKSTLKRSATMSGGFAELTKTPIMAIVKANGYGHGAVESARAAIEAGAEWCGVARFEEALALRQAGLNCHLLVMGYTPPACLQDAIDRNISLTIYDLELGDVYPRQLPKSSKPLNIHVKVDTGMGRLGIKPGDALKLIERLSRTPGITVEGFCTHFAKADETDRTSTLEQLERFIPLVRELEHRGLRPEIVHAANSAAALQYPESRFDLIRPGIAMYGLNPSSDTPLPAEF